MSGVRPGGRPPSPPRSDGGDFGLMTIQSEVLREPYTPPGSLRPTSIEPTYEQYEEYSAYPPPPAPVYYSPQPTFMRHMSNRSTPVGIDNSMATRGGRTIGLLAESPSMRASRSPRAKRVKATKPYKKGVPILTAPLSELTQEYDVPVRDMGAWVNRPVEDRMQEVEKKKGYVSRPMNSFMLYRSAYAERVKRFCKENNHQVVSQVTGVSWPLEPKEIRAKYEQYAIIERDNHASANPGYKFAPNKSGRKRGRNEDDGDSDSDWEGSRSTKRSRRGGRDDTRSLSGTPFEPDHGYAMYHQLPQPHPSSYQAMNPRGPPPFNFGPSGMTHGYYQTQAMPYAPNVDDIKFEGPYPDYGMGQSIIGMPDAGHHELLGAPAIHPMHGMSQEQMVDPRLSGLDPSYSYAHYETPEDTYSVPRSLEYASYPHPAQGHGMEPVHPGMATLTDGPEEWLPNGESVLDFERELQSF